MRKKLIFLILAVMPMLASAQTIKEKHKPFYTTEEAPHLENILPAPPGLQDPLFFNDWCQYQWGKSVRDTERGKLAVSDATIGASYFFKRFSPAVHRELTEEKYPILHELLYKAHMTEMQAGWSAKKHFARVRPYQQFKEESGVPSHDNPTDFTSYPSGHTHASWLAGMILTAIDPDHAEEIMKVAYEMGQSRVIVGFHYQSDVDAGRVAASVTFARLCAMPEFLDKLAAAKAEYKANN